MAALRNFMLLLLVVSGGAVSTAFVPNNNDHLPSSAARSRDNNSRAVHRRTVKGRAIPPPFDIGLVGQAVEIREHAAPVHSSSALRNKDIITPKEKSAVPGTRWVVPCIVLSLCLWCSFPDSVGATGFGPSGATMSPPKDVWSTNKNNNNVQQQQLKTETASPWTKDFLGKPFDKRDSETEENKAMVHNADSIIMMDPSKTKAEQQQQQQQQQQQDNRLVVQDKTRDEYMERLEAQPYWFDYSAAFLGSVGSTLIMHPMDTIKTRLQVRGISTNNNNNGGTTTTRTTTTKQSGSIPCYRNGTATVESTSIDHDEPTELLTDNLYQGLTGNIWKEGPSSALSLSVYEFVKLGLLRATAVTPAGTGAAAGAAGRFVVSRFQVYLLAGAAGELVGSVVQAPAEVIKSLLQSRKAKTPAQALGMVVEQPEGVVRAWSAAIWRDVPFSAIQLAVFEMIKAYILNHPEIFNGFDSTTLQAEAMIGAFAGGCGALLTNPSDVVTARIITQQQRDEQSSTFSTQSGDRCRDGEPIVNTVMSKQEETPLLGVGEMVKRIYEEGGVPAFFVGWQARVGYWAPAISIFLTTYCSIRQAGIQYHLFD